MQHNACNDASSQTEIGSPFPQVGFSKKNTKKAITMNKKNNKGGKLLAVNRAVFEQKKESSQSYMLFVFKSFSNFEQPITLAAVTATIAGGWLHVFMTALSKIT